MADKKISQLTAATIPLAGTEPVPLVQSGNTVKATAQNIANLAIPSQTGQGGKYLTTNGSVASWGTVSGGTPTYQGRFSVSSSVLSTTILSNTSGRTITPVRINFGIEFTISPFIDIDKLNYFATNYYYQPPQPLSYYSFSPVLISHVISGGDSLVTIHWVDPQFQRVATNVYDSFYPFYVTFYANT